MKYFNCLCSLIVVVQLSSQAAIENRIIYGEKGSIEEYPYQVFIFGNLGESTTGVLEGGACGGSIISKTYVLTAGHCITTRKETSWVKISNEKLYIQAGTSTASIDSSAVHPEKVILHPKYHINFKLIGDMWTTEDLENDIGIMRVKDPFIETDKIATISLPFQRQTELWLSGKTAVITGYGLINGDKLNKDLYALNVIMPESYDCKEGEICLPVKNERTFCGGDSGGPLVINKVQYGIVSTSSFPAETPSCHFHTSMQFANVTYHLDWISKVTHIKNKDDPEEQGEDSEGHDEDSEESKDEFED